MSLVAKGVYPVGSGGFARFLVRTGLPRRQGP
jgi:hypothetical protein